MGLLNKAASKIVLFALRRNPTMATILKRLPLVSTFLLLIATLLKQFGFDAAAHALDAILSLGWLSVDPTIPPIIVSGVGAIYKIWLLLKAQFASSN